MKREPELKFSSFKFHCTIKKKGGGGINKHYSKEMLLGLSQRILPHSKQIPVDASSPSFCFSWSPSRLFDCQHHSNIRSAAHDFGKELSTFAHIEQNVQGHGNGTEKLLNGMVFYF